MSSTEQIAQSVIDAAGLAQIGIKYSRSQRDRLEAAGKFPRRVRLGCRKAVYVVAEIQNWLAARIAERDTTVQS
jgi:predicted DNA-binding transcriptional regulator AlpA